MIRKRLHRLKQITRALFFLPVVLTAIVWRRTALRNVTVIGVTGSVGKTTAKEYLAAILRQVGPTAALRTSSNGRYALPSLLLGARPSHRFVVAEVGILKPGRMWRSAFTLKPDIAVITNVNWQHSVNFDSLDQVAEQKAKLLDALGEHGIAVLNADNPRVAAMAQGRPCRVIRFGSSESADVRGSEVSAQWPDAFAVSVESKGERQRIQTRLFGKHWTPSVLAAIAVARELGASWEQCRDAALQLPPYPGRMNSLELPSGAHLLRDEYNGTFATLERALEVLSEARCTRRVVAIGNIQDTPQFGELGPEEAAKCCAAVADLMLFWGPFKDRYRAAALEAGAPPDRITTCATQGDLALRLKEAARAGDLIVLKGTWFDHMARVAYAQFGTVGCRLEKCPIHHTCDRCPRIGFEADPDGDTTLVEQLLEGQKRIGVK